MEIIFPVIFPVRIRNILGVKYFSKKIDHLIHEDIKTFLYI